MKTPLIRAYGNEIARDTARQIVREATLNSPEVIDKSSNKLQTDQNSISKSRYSNFDPNKVITKKEREFFVNMFPENAEQIQRHVLFNKSGRTSSPSIYKGTIVDGRV